MSRSSRLGICAVLVVLAVLAAPGVASAADLGWSAAQQISSTGQTGTNPSLAVNDAGQGIIAWNETDIAGRIRIRARYRLPGENFGDPVGAYTDNNTVYVSVQSADAVRPTAVIDGNGNALIAWYRPGVIRVVSGNPATGLGGATAVTGSDDVTGGPGLAMDAQGNAILGYVRDVGGNPQVVSRYKPAGGAWGPAQLVWDSSTTSAPGPGAVRAVGSLVVGMDEQGNAAFSWAFNSNQWNQDPFLREIRAAFRPAGTASPWETAAQFPTQTRGNSSVRSAAPRRIAMKDGATIVYWGSTDTSDSRAHVNVRPLGGPWNTTTETLSYVDSTNNNSGHWGGTAVEFDPSGNAMAIFNHGLNGGEIYESFRAAGSSTFGARRQIVPPSGSLAAQFKFDDAGKAAVVWVRHGPAGSQSDHVVAALRSPGEAGTLGAQPEISGEGELYSELVDPQLSVSMTGPGQAFAAWSRIAKNSGNPAIVEVSTGTPVDDPVIVPPPPPPPPPPPIPSPNGTIELARPAKAGEATVLTFRPTGSVTSIEWTGVGQTVTGRVINGRLQNSIRFHAGGRSAKVTVKATGPGGTTTVSKTFILPAEPRDALSKEVLSALDKKAGTISRVIALSFSADALTGKSGCATTTVVSGRQSLTACFEPIDKSSDIPTAELGVLVPIAKKLGLNRSNAPLMQTAVGLLDGYITKSSLATPSGFPIEPKRGASLVSFPQADALTSSDAEITVGGVGVKPPGDGFNLNLDPSDATTALGKLPRPANLPKISGLEFGNDFDVELLPGGEARIKTTIKLPPIFSAAGVDVGGSVTLTATPDRFIIEDFVIGPISADLGALKVERFQLKYNRDADQWDGIGKACIGFGPCLNMNPPAGHVTIKDGRVFFLGATLDFSPGSIPLAPGVAMQTIQFGFGQDPIRVFGGTRILVGELVYVDGKMVMGFPTADHPFRLNRDEIPGFPDRLYNTNFTGFTLGVTAEVGLRLSDVWNLPLGGGYVLYEYPGYLALGGHTDIGLKIDGFLIVGIRGSVDGEFSAVTKKFNVDGHVYACLVDVLCAGVDANVSSRGLSACTVVDVGLHELHMGGAVRYSPFKFIPYLDDCKWGRFREPNVRGKAQLRKAQAGDTVGTFDRKDTGDPSEMMMFTGNGGSPMLSVETPGGEVVNSPTAAGIVTSKDGTVRLMRSAEQKFVAVGLADAKKGDYDVKMMPGSPGIAKVEEATALPDAKGGGIVRGDGATKTLEYDITDRPNQTVRFVDIDPSGAGADIKTITGGGKGSFKFNPKPGKGIHRIEARIELDGVPAETLPIARYRPPSPVFPKPSGIKVKRSGTKLIVTWKKIADASGYAVALSPSTGEPQKFFTSRKNTLTIKGVSKTVAGSVSIMATSKDRQGRAASARFKRLARAASPFSDLMDCKKKGKKLTCK